MCIHRFRSAIYILLFYLIFYVPERDIMNLTVSARFLIHFDFRGGGGGQRVHNVS